MFTGYAATGFAGLWRHRLLSLILIDLILSFLSPVPEDAVQAALDDAAGGVLVALRHAPAGVLVPGDAEYAEGRGDHKGVSNFPWASVRPCADKQFASAKSLFRPTSTSLVN